MQELRKFNDEEFYLRGRKIVYIKNIAQQNKQCMGCVFFNENCRENPCPRNESDLICEQDKTGQWKYIEDEEVKQTNKRTLNGREVIQIITNNDTNSYCDQCVFNYKQTDEPCPETACAENNSMIWKFKDESKVINGEAMINQPLKGNPTVTVTKPVDKTLNPLQGRKYDSGKPMYNLIPAEALEEVVKVLTAGAIKYNEPLDQENWRLVDNPQSRYFAAAQRHIWADKRGETLDIDKVNPDGSISKGTDCYHLACAIASLMFMLQLKIEEGKEKVNE